MSVCGMRVHVLPNAECIVSTQKGFHQKFLLEFSDSIVHCLNEADAISGHAYFHACQCDMHLPKATLQPLHCTWHM